MEDGEVRFLEYFAKRMFLPCKWLDFVLLYLSSVKNNGFEQK